MVNYNPETVSTDFDECDRLYFEELTFETVMDIYQMETVEGVILAMGGQIPNNMAMDLHRQQVNVFGTSPEMIDGAENRFKFSRMCDQQGIDQPSWKELTSVEDAHVFCEEVGYPCLMRPSYILSGVGMRVVHSQVELERDFKEAGVVNREYPVVISKFILDSKEVEVDAVACKGVIVAHAISEHVENAGVHSGDATIIHPPQDLTEQTMASCLRIAAQVAKALKINGPFNIQFIANNENIKVIECNVRVSRSFPFVSKTMGVDMIAIATRVMVDRVAPAYVKPAITHIGVKVPQFSFSRLAGADPTLGVDMISTGEVACFGETKEEAYLKAMQAVKFPLPSRGSNVLLSIGSYAGKKEFVASARSLVRAGYLLFGSLGTADFYQSEGIAIQGLEWLNDMNEQFSIQEQLVEGKFELVINLPMRSKYRRPGNITAGFAARRGAVDHKVPLITNIKCAKLFVRAICTLDIEPHISMIDCQRSYLSNKFPGLVAVAVPCGSAAAESASSLSSLTRQAISGGFTSVVVLPTIETAALRQFVAVAGAQAFCSFAFLPSVAEGDAEAVTAAAGAAPTRVSPVASSPGRHRGTSVSEPLADSLEHAVHPVGLVLNVDQLAKSVLDVAKLLEAWPDNVPLCIAATAGGHDLSAAILFAHLNDRAVHILSVTGVDQLALIGAAKAKGVDVTCSVDLHTLFPDGGTAAAHSSPLWDGAVLEQVDVIAVGANCPYKFNEVLPLLVAAATALKIDLDSIIAKVSTNPAGDSPTWPHR
jgi:carbamoylphosphate synthase large subunit